MLAFEFIATAYRRLLDSRTVTGHARLAGDTSRNEDDLGALEGSGNAAVLLGLVASDLAHIL